MQQETQFTYRRVASKAASAACFALGCAPVFVLLNWVFLPDAPWAWATSIFFAWFLAWIMGLPKGKRRVYSGCLGLLLLALLFAVQWSAREIYLLFPTIILYWLILRAAGKPPFQEWSFGALLGCGGLYLAGLTGASRFGLQEAASVLSVLIWLDMPVLLLLINRGFLLRESWAREGQTPHRRLLMGNQKLTLALAVVALLLANLHSLGKAFSVAVGWVARIVGVAFLFLMSLFQGESPSGEGVGGSMGMPPMEEAGEAAPFWAILEKIFIVFGCIVAIIVVFIILWKLYRIIHKALQGVVSRMKAMMASLGQDVKEETVSLFDWTEWREEAKKQVGKIRKRLQRQPRWADLDNRGRVRWAYVQLLRRMGNVKESMTAREILSQHSEGTSLADIYDKARYSKEIIEDGDATAMGDAARREE